MSSAVEALVSSYPDRFDAASGQQWVAARRAALVVRAESTQRADGSVSSGCALTGARTHARHLAAEAADALARWDAGLGTTCADCNATIDFERLDSGPAVVRCTACARAVARPVDTRWCR
ncbi:MAG: hypothetical protein ACT4PP_05620 [Sporichthyaceae bacterium]